MKWIKYFEVRRFVGLIFVSLGEFPNDEDDAVVWWIFDIGKVETYWRRRRKQKLI